MVSFDSYDRFVRDFYSFAVSKLQIRADPLLTKVLLVCNPREQEDWEGLRRFVELLGSPEALGWSEAKAIAWVMPATRDERVSLSLADPKIMPSAYVDYDAFVCPCASKLYADSPEIQAADLHYTMASACIQLASMKSRGIAGVVTVLGNDKLAAGLLNVFLETHQVEDYAVRK
jgi:hypothetical protein